jgi:tRNA-dihydrouridine synthase
MRTGYADASELTALVAEIAPLPLARLTVHGRTRPDGYRGKARWDLIARTAASVAMPVFASGDVVDAASLARLAAAAPRIAGVLIGRGALRNPWIFREIETGASVALPFAAIDAAVTTFALLSEIWATAPDALVATLTRGELPVRAGPSADAWWEAARVLHRALSGPRPAFDAREPLRFAPNERRTMGRVKLLWSYLRSSLPGGYFAPPLLRPPRLAPFLAALRQHHAEVADASGRDRDEPLVLRHDPAVDWLYAGERKTPPPGATVPGEGAACATVTTA